MNSSLIHTLTMKNRRTLEEMFAIINMYDLTEKETLDTRE
jgi:hypothetical protein